MRELTYSEAIAEALDQAMMLCKDVFVMGQLVDYKPGIFGTTQGLADKYGRDRVRDFPNAESVMTSTAIGAALVGKRPVLVHPRVDFMIYSLDAIVNWLSLWRFKSNKKSNLPVTIRAIIGKGWGQGPQHSKNLHSWFTHLPGLKVAMPATAYDIKGLMLESIFSESPTVILENRALFSMRDNVPEKPYRVRFGKAAVRREGQDVTLVCLGLTVPLTLKVAELLAPKGVRAEVIDLRTLSPMDIDTVTQSVSKTRKLAVIDSSWKTLSIASEVIASVALTHANVLNANPVRITLPDSHTPMNCQLENAFYLDEKKILKALEKVL